MLLTRLTTLFAACAVPLAHAQQGSIYVDFGDPGAGFGTPDTSYIALSAAPGVWNAVDLSLPAGGGSFTSGPLLDAAGTATGVTCALASTSSLVTTFAANAQGTSGNDEALLDDCVRFGGEGSLTFTGLPAGDYNVFTIAVAPDEAADPVGRATLVSVVGSTSAGRTATGELGFGGTFATGATHTAHPVSLDGSTPLVILVEGFAGAVESVNGVQISPRGVSPILDTRFCVGNPNSTGVVGRMSASGSTWVLANDLTLEATNLPPGEFGIFVVSREAGANIPVNQGILCLSGRVGRIAQPGQIFQADAAGRATVGVDMFGSQAPFGIVGVPLDGTWYFQAWHRDAPQGSSNFTEGISVTLH